jgi:hypothetical protein
MLKDKFTRHTIAFVIIALSAVLLYPVALADAVTLTWILLGTTGLAAFLTIITK